ncbi:TNF receptor-associated factor 3-like [Dysidea avara]|uniref:TNF receptor-associated factor 3-like n=1 Tax=Dysidea avara TaxID=196820 RepID=UPI00332E0422
MTTAARHAVTKTSLIQLNTVDERLQCVRCGFLLNGPLQLQCSHRICTPCAMKLKQQSSPTFFCEQCQTNVEFTGYFHDKVIAKEIDFSVVSCPHCGWTGEYRYYQKHLKEGCQLVKVSSPYEGCNKEVPKSQIDDECNFNFLGCQFKATRNDKELVKHMDESQKDHILLVCKYLSSKQYQSPHSPQRPNGMTSICSLNTLEESMYSELDKIHEKMDSTKHKENVLQIIEVQSKQKDISFRLTGVEDLLSTLQASINEINHTYEEVSLTLQTLQATSYDGNYVWKIPDITRRRRDALLGKTVSLYSAPFYTSRFGYRLCLRVYLDGDGSGKGRYISYFLTIMKGEYDALLEWPFQHMVTMTLVNQKGNNNIVQSFRPNPTSTSFHRPKSDMNVASGCPKFAPLSILDNPEFVVDDVAFFKCDINVNKL